MELTQRMDKKFIRAVALLSYEERLRTLELFRLWKAKLQDDLRADFQYLKRVYRKARKGLFCKIIFLQNNGELFLS